MLKIITSQNSRVVRRHDPSLALLGSVKATLDHIALVSQSVAELVLLLRWFAESLGPLNGFLVVAGEVRMSFRLDLGYLSLLLLVLQVLV